LYPDIYPWYFNFKVEEPLMGRFDYARRYCDPKQYKARGITQWSFKGYDNPEELNAVLSTFMVRRRKEVILPFLPSKNRSCITLDPLKPKQYREIAKLLIEDRKRKEEEEKIENKNPEKFMKSFRLTCRYKIPNVIKFVKQHVIDNIMKEDPDVQILIFSHHVITREAIEECLTKHNISHFSLHGSTNFKKRAEYEHDFQNTKKYKVGVLSIYAACTGLTLTKASIVIFTELLFGPDIMFQAEDRVHRISQVNDVNILYLIEPKTTDDINWGLIKKKERESSNILDGKKNYISGRRIKPDNDNLLVSGENISLNDGFAKITTKRKRKRAEGQKSNEGGGTV
jgi:SWI/SNF-related matrix-associated actin-dependent regulator of chromatin subfamily A-like protein 1